MTTTTVRDAVPDDAAALIRIREVMLTSFLDDLGDGSWRGEAAEVLREQLETGAMIGVLAEVDGAVVSGALARVWRQIPGPDDDGRRAWIFSVATEEPFRRQGLARQVVERVVERLDAAGLPRIDLTASAEGMDLYLSLGFAPSDAPLLRRRRP
jgi:GNAT superfamily N-acetyltransferase